MKKPLLLTGLIVVIAIAAGFIVRSWRGGAGRPPPVNVKLLEILGAVAAEETIALVGDRAQIVVVGFAAGPRPVPERTVPFEAWRKALQAHAGITVTATELIPAGKVEASLGPGFSAELFEELLQKHGSTDAIVSFIGAPFVPAEEWRQLPAKRPAWLAVGATPLGLKPLLQAGIVQAAIVPRMGPPPSPMPPSTPREEFDQRYQVITLENLTELPDA